MTCGGRVQCVLSHVGVVQVHVILTPVLIARAALSTHLLIMVVGLHSVLSLEPQAICQEVTRDRKQKEARVLTPVA